MPTVATANSTSARAFGHIGGRIKPRVVKSKVFTGNETWVVPANVTFLINASGEGADGTPDEWRWASHNTMTCVNSSTNQGPLGGSSVSLSAAVDDGLNEVAKFSGTATRVITWHPITYTVGPDNLARRTTGSRVTTVRGSHSPNPGPTSGSLTHTPKNHSLVAVGVETKYNGTTGANATGFGLTFPGGNKEPATTTEFSNVAVNPNQSYSIVVPSGGSITIFYYE